MRRCNRFVGMGAGLVFAVAACGDDPSRIDSLSADETVASTTTELPVPETAAPVTQGVPTTFSGVDPADQYMTATTEVYRRTLPTGNDFVVELSDSTYAEVFGLTWSAPTGTADMCLGDHALFMGVPGEVGWWGSAWVAHVWSDQFVEPDLYEAVGIVGWMGSGVEMSDRSVEFLLLRANPGVSDVILSLGDGTEIDRATVSNGLAMVTVDAGVRDDESQRGGLVATSLDPDGRSFGPRPLTYASIEPPSECGPGDLPPRPLPPAGDQPSDPVGAEQEIRDRHALLVNRSIPESDKPADLMDDDTGVDDAVAELNAGQFRDDADYAVYTIEAVVFTSPTEAWFRYTIRTPASTFGDRFGVARFNGSVWQITRATVCQDLELAFAPCVPPAANEPPPNPEWEALYQEWVGRAMLYTGNDGCPPLSQC